ncbi:hypothetical protein LshimejAT787_0901580 [Lyophyllum shimeji]|uniref:Uncharacterized protein n=1 Tax=Lyophyllum shimeji TaxID=47721 RepID=A0A9P3UPR7_LYOSH|nr:hypothetical protein LshimejAT787_0901580 [Lyophyllum shimeji]
MPLCIPPTGALLLPSCACACPYRFLLKDSQSNSASCPGCPSCSLNKAGHICRKFPLDDDVNVRYVTTLSRYKSRSAALYGRMSPSSRRCSGSHEGLGDLGGFGHVIRDEEVEITVDFNVVPGPIEVYLARPFARVEAGSQTS